MINPSGFLDGDTRELSQRKKESYDAALPKWQGWWQNASIDRRYALGDQRYLNYFANANYKEQKFIFNFLHSQIQSVLGIQRKNRKSSVVVPSTMGSDQTASQLTKVLMWCYAQDNVLEKISTGCYNALVTGLTMFEIWKDTNKDPFSGDFKLKEFPSSSFIMDPWWRNQDLSDCGFWWGREYMSLLQIINLMPDYEKELKNIRPSQNPDIRFSFMPEAYQVMYRNKANYAYDRYMYMSERTRTMVYNMNTHQKIEFPEDEDIDDWMMNQVPEDERQHIEIVEQTIPCVRQCISVSDKIIYDDYLADRYPLAPMVAYFDPESIDYSFRFFGIPRLNRDWQYIYNRKQQLQLDTWESMPTSGINVVEDALINEADAFKTGAGQVRVIKKGYIPDQVIGNIQPPSVAPDSFAMTESIPEMANRQVGITPEMIGMNSSNDVGIIEVLRQNAGISAMQTVFDNIDICQKMISEIYIDNIQKYFTEGKIFNICGEEPTDEFKDKAFFEYNCQIEDGLNTTTQKQMEYAQLLQLAQLPKIGEIISPQDILEASTLQNKDKIIKNMMEREQQQMQMQQQQAQAQAQQFQAQTDMLMSQAETNRAMGAERMSRINENEMLAVERRAKAENEYELAQLKKVEALKKLEEIDLSKIERLLNILDHIEMSEKGVYPNGPDLQQHSSGGQQPRNEATKEPAQAQVRPGLG